MLACMPMNVWNKYFDFILFEGVAATQETPREGGESGSKEEAQGLQG